MAITNKLKSKHKEEYTQQQSHNIVNPKCQSTQNIPVYFSQQKHTKQKQQQYQSYYQISQCNPNGVYPTAALFPDNHQLNNNFNIPLGFECSPLLCLQNQCPQIMLKTADQIPRCDVCRAYMNCYNRIQNNKYSCFLCGSQQKFINKFHINSLKEQLNSSIYQALSPQNYYQFDSSEQTYIFMIDICPDSARTKILYYAIAAMKEVFSRSQLDDIIIYFFTYDQILQEYDFVGQDVKCIIYDQTLQQKVSRNKQKCCLKDIRDKIYCILDSLEDISLNNTRNGSNFTNCFDQVFNLFKHTHGKFYILQCNQGLTAQTIFWEYIPQSKKQPTHAIQKIADKIPSFYQSRNKTFFNKYTEQALKQQCSFSFFVFYQNFKNLKVLSDFIKLTSSELKIYNKNLETENERFYYQFVYLLGVSYFKNVRLELVISKGWYFTSVYGNYRKLKQHITYSISYFQPSRKITILVSPSKFVINRPPSYCCFQMITNYRYKMQSYISIATIVQPLTGYLQKLYQTVDYRQVNGIIGKIFLSSLRMIHVNNARKQIISMASNIYKSALKFYGNHQNIPDFILSIIMSVLAMLKSSHSQPELYNNIPTFDKIVGERNFLQSCGLNELNTFFNPYLFDLNNLNQSMCQQDNEFKYPRTIQPKFQNTQEGIFLLENGITLYLYISRSFNPQQLQLLFGKSTISKQESFTQQMLQNQQNPYAMQIKNLIKYLRQQKSYGWIPLIIVKFGEDTAQQRAYYLNYYGQKFAEYRMYKFNIAEFIDLIIRVP